MRNRLELLLYCLHLLRFLVDFQKLRPIWKSGGNSAQKTLVTVIFPDNFQKSPSNWKTIGNSA